MNIDFETALSRGIDHVFSPSTDPIPDRDEGIGISRHLLVAQKTSASPVPIPIRGKLLDGDMVTACPSLAQLIYTARAAGDDFGDSEIRVVDGRSDDLRICHDPIAEARGLSLY